ncbi:MAG: hypothetical protein BKP49_01670 [Treponema sp. CETP13]|nr:MAG: hypothetical protein BKP49_01670 [Treponema sp. CETP13]
MMKKIFFIISILILFLIPLQALQVNKTELEKATINANIVFQNYTGPHAKIDSIDEIRAIGQQFATPINQDITTSNQVGDSNYYQIIHAIDASTNTGLDADILIVGQNATVDHIKNLRRIIGAYLETAYGYSQEDADTLSVFITVYNAVYYKNLNAFLEVYKKVVTENLDENICGLSVNYQDWPGKTQIVIPLSNINGGLSTIETSIISDKQVVQSMQEDPEKQIEVRKDMVDIKEREANNATEEAQAAQKEATKAKEEVSEEKKVLQTTKEEAIEAQDNAEEAKEEAITAQKIAEENPDNLELQKIAQEKQAESENKDEIATTKAQEVEAQEDIVEEKQAIATEKQTEATEKQAIADKKQSEAQDERIEIAEDQLAVIKAKAEAAKIIHTTYGLKMSDTKKMLSTLVLINSDTGLMIKESPVSYIRNRIVLPNGENYTAVVGENSGNGAVKLVTLDKDNMEIIDESDYFIAEDSVLVSDGQSFYAILQDSTDYVLGKFNTDLDLVLKSVVSVLPQSPIIVSENGISVTDANGMIKLLNIKDLSEIQTE